MTKLQYIDFIRNLMGGKPHRKDVEFAIDQAYQQVVSMTSSKALATYNFLSKEFKDVPVTLDTDTDKYYSDLPAATVFIPKVNKGVLHINTMEGTDLQFFPMTESEWELTGGSIFDTIQTDIGFILRTGTVYYYNMDSLTADAGVRMTLAVNFSAFADDDMVNMPGGMSADITQIARDILLGQVPRETKNDYR